MKIHISQYDLISETDKPLVEEFIRSILVQLKKGTINTYKNSLGLFYLCLDEIAISQAHKINRKHITYWLQELNARGYAASTKIHHIFCVRLYLSWLFEMKHSRKNPYALIVSTDLPKLPKMFPRDLPSETDLRLISYLSQSQHFYDKCLLLMRYTGLRMSDLLALEFNPIITNEQGQAFLRGTSPKFNKQYSVPIDNKTIDLISVLQTHAQQNHPMTAPSTLITDPRGRGIAALLRAHLHAISPLVSDRPITPHQLRHTFATSMINAGMGLYSVMKLLGHEDMRMTLRYANLYPTTLHKDFQLAIQNLTHKYEINSQKQTPASNFDPLQAFEDINQCLRNSSYINEKKTLSIIKRLSRLKIETELLLNQNTPPLE